MVSKWTLTLITAANLLIAVNNGVTGTATRASDSPTRLSTVTPVEGPSWLKHLGIEMSDTRLGQMGGDGTIPATARREPQLWQRQPAQVLREQFGLTGADLYRINCRACHGPDGQGAPPEIHSLNGPAQATSPDAIQRRMEARGASISQEMAGQMASEAEKAIRERLQNGGEKMPAFSYLRPEEVVALLSYLRQLAGVSGKHHAAVVTESAAHVGEQIIKGTCHTCHDATGRGRRGMMAMMSGIPPSLASLPYDYSLNRVMRQVHYGGRRMMMRGNRMPPFPYFTDEEIAAAYLYLEAYSPIN